jgi:hypothetical protein
MERSFHQLPGRTTTLPNSPRQLRTVWYCTILSRAPEEAGSKRPDDRNRLQTRIRGRGGQHVPKAVYKTLTADVWKPYAGSVTGAAGATSSPPSRKLTLTYCTVDRHGRFWVRYCTGYAGQIVARSEAALDVWASGIRKCLFPRSLQIREALGNQPHSSGILSPGITAQ